MLNFEKSLRHLTNLNHGLNTGAAKIISPNSKGTVINETVIARNSKALEKNTNEAMRFNC